MDVLAALLVQIFALWTTGAALECYSCTSKTFSTSAGVPKSILDGLSSQFKEDPRCSEESLLRGEAPTATCPPNSICGDLRMSLTMTDILTGSGLKLTITEVQRGCMEEPDIGLLDSEICVDGRKQAEAAVRQEFSTSGILQLYDFKVNVGDICYCNSNLCSKGRCAKDTFKLGNNCVKIWYIAVPAAVLLIFIVGIVGYCCCCRNKQNKTPTTTSHSLGPPGQPGSAAYPMGNHPAQGSAAYPMGNYPGQAGPHVNHAYDDRNIQKNYY